MGYLLTHAVDHWAEIHPESPAAACLDQRLSYRELARQSNQLAHQLAELGVKRGDRVGICTQKTIHVPVAIYGIMKAGAAYVPLDPSAPADRLAGIIEDCSISVVVSSDARIKLLNALTDALPARLILIGIDAEVPGTQACIGWSELERQPDAPPDRKIIEQDLAYIIYTSGSTGRPKGIMHTHASGLCFARWAVREYGFTSADRMANTAPLHFDLSIMDYFAASLAGAATVLVPEDHARMPASYTKYIEDQRITVLYTVPFALIQMLHRGAMDQRDLSSVRWMIFGGEPFSPASLKSLMAKLPDVRFDNIYGPAEVNGCTHLTLSNEIEEDRPLPIGPIADIAEALIVDASDRPVETGEIGVLLVRTPTMMQGYWNRPDLNERAFFRRPISSGYEHVFYRTGDLVNADADAILTFYGRADRQIKVRGYRVELDEVELALNAHSDVEEAAAIAVPAADEHNVIVGLARLKVGAGGGVAELRKHLKTRLPWYAVPAATHLIEDFPRTTTGKIDRRQLRELCMQDEQMALSNS